MSGIVGSLLNIRGSGIIDKVGTSGQILTSAGAGAQAAFAAAAGGGGKVLKTYQEDFDGADFGTVSDSYVVVTGLLSLITLTSDTSSVLCTWMSSTYINTSGTWAVLGIQRKVTSDDSDSVDFGAADVGDHTGGTYGMGTSPYPGPYKGRFISVMDNFSTSDPGSRDGLQLTYSLLLHGTGGANVTAYGNHAASTNSCILMEIEAN